MNTDVFGIAIYEQIEHRLRHLTCKCVGCPQVLICEDQGDNGESRYCWPIIAAAILGEEEWKTAFRKSEQIGTEVAR